MFSRADFDALAADGITRAWNGLGGSHTFVTYPPLDALGPLEPQTMREGLSSIAEFNLYVHLPFCEMSCPFCPYETHVVSGADNRVDHYLRALAQEMAMLAPGLRNAQVQTLYVGGGTATVLSAVQFERLFADLRKHFALGSQSLICVETSPNALIQDAGKIDLLKELSVKRISVGVQTLSEVPLRNEGRTHDPAETVDILKKLIGKFDTVNVDLMQDMPGQTDRDLLNDIAQIAKLEPPQVTWYVERLRQSQGRFPDACQSVQRRLWIRDRMKEISYRPSPGGRFVRPVNETDAFKKIRCGLDSHLVGLGASAYGHVPGCFYRNVVDTAAYTSMVLAGNMPIAKGFHLRKIDMAAGALASGIRWGATVPPAEAETAGYIGYAASILELLRRHGLVRFNPDSEKYQITLDGLGWAYEEEICSLFVPLDIVEQIRAQNLPWWHNEPPH